MSGHKIAFINDKNHTSYKHFIYIIIKPTFTQTIESLFLVLKFWTLTLQTTCITYMLLLPLLPLYIFFLRKLSYVLVHIVAIVPSSFIESAFKLFQVVPSFVCTSICPFVRYESQVVEHLSFLGALLSEQDFRLSRLILFRLFK